MPLLKQLQQEQQCSWKWNSTLRSESASPCYPGACVSNSREKIAIFNERSDTKKIFYFEISYISAPCGIEFARGISKREKTAERSL